jgi:hypothetical protein
MPLSPALRGPRAERRHRAALSFAPQREAPPGDVREGREPGEAYLPLARLPCARSKLLTFCRAAASRLRVVMCSVLERDRG